MELKFPAKLYLERPITIIGRNFEVDTSEPYITFDSETKFIIEKWVYGDNRVYLKEVSKEEYDKCDYPHISLSENSDEYTKRFEEYIIIRANNFTIKIKLGNDSPEYYDELESCVEEIFEAQEYLDSHPEEEDFSEINLLEHFRSKDKFILMDN